MLVPSYYILEPQLLLMAVPVNATKGLCVLKKAQKDGLYLLMDEKSNYMVEIIKEMLTYFP